MTKTFRILSILHPFSKCISTNRRLESHTNTAFLPHFMRMVSLNAPSGSAISILLRTRLGSISTEYSLSAYGSF